jgi:HSP20 family protein
MAEKTVPTPTKGGEEIATQETTRAQEQYIRPPVDIYETESGLVLVADLPGVKREDLEIQVNNNVLSITGRTHDAMPGTGIYREYDLVSFYREFQIGTEVDQENIEAELKHGVLTLTLKKAAKALPKKVEVKFA